MEWSLDILKLPEEYGIIKSVWYNFVEWKGNEVDSISSILTLCLFLRSNDFIIINVETSMVHPEVTMLL